MTLLKVQQILKSRDAIVRNQSKGFGFFITINSVVICSAGNLVELYEKFLLT